MLERIQALNEKVYEQLRQSLSNEGEKSELERFMTSGISKSVSNETLAEITTVSNKYTNSFFLNVVEEPESVSRIADEKFGFFAGSGKC